MNGDRDETDEKDEVDDVVEGADRGASSELEKLRATASSLSELSMGLNEMVETLSRIIARDEVPLED